MHLDGLTTLKLDVSIDRKTSLPCYKFCATPHSSYSHFFVCSSVPQIVSLLLTRLRAAVYGNRLSDTDLLLLLRVTSLIREYRHEPKRLLSQLAATFSNIFIAI
jgi:hypothetical protein